jgi:hypothetical protein
MYHRYGRHGPDAWLRRRKRRFVRHLPIVASSVAVVPVPIFENTERIIIIVADENLRENFPGRSMIRSIPGEEGILLEGASNDCWREGRKRGIKAKSEEDIPSFSELENEGIAAVDEYIDTHHLPNVEVNKNVVMKLEESYLEGYCDAFKISLDNAEQYFQKNQTRSIRALARRDMAADVRYNVQLSREEIELQGAIRAVNELNLAARCGTDYMQRVRPYAKAYARYYSGEEGGDSFRRPTS